MKVKDEGQIRTDFQQLVEKWTKFIDRNNTMIKEMEVYILYGPKQGVKKRFKETIAMFMKQNNIAIKEKAECLHQLNRIEEDMYTAMFTGIMTMK